MAQPKPSPFSIRCTPELQSRIGAYAAAHNITRNKAAVNLLETALRSVDVIPQRSATPKAILALAEASAAHLGTPKPRKRAWSLKGVPVGPPPSIPGSRLKTAKGHR